MVVDNVQDDLDPGPVERLHQVPELVDRGLRAWPAGVGAVRGKERHRLVAPVVGPAAGRVLGVELVHGQQLDRGDPEVDEVRDFLDEPGVGPADRRVHAAVGVGREPADVGLVDHGVRERPVQRPVALPVVRAEVNDHALHRAQVVVPSAVLAGAAGRPAVAGRHGHAPPVRVQQDPVAVEAQPALGCPRAMGPEAVHLAGPDAGHECMPVRPGPVGVRVEVDDARRHVVVHPIEQHELDPGGPFGVDGHVHTVGREGRANGVARARLRGRDGFDGLEDGLHRGRLGRLGIAYSPTLACIIPPSTT